MSVKTEMMRAVMNVIAIRKGITNLEDNDIAFLEAAGNYGASIDRDNAAFGQSELRIAINKVDGPTGPTGSTSLPKATPLSAFKGGTGAAAPQPAEIDRGPEPQTVSDTIDPETPLPADDTLNQDSSQPEILSTKRS